MAILRAALLQNPMQYTAARGCNGSQREIDENDNLVICGTIRKDASPCDSKDLHRTPRQGLECDSVKPEKAKDLGKSQKQRDPESDAVSPKTDVDHPEITQKADNKAKRLEVIADLLANLNKPERQKVIEQLSPADRAAVALMLVNEKD